MCSGGTHDVFTAVKIQVEVFWVVTCCVMEGYQHFRGPCHLLPQYYMVLQPRGPRLKCAVKVN